MAVGVGVDQAGNDQAAGVDDFGICIYVGDDIAFNDDVARLAARRRDQMHQSACDHEHGNGPCGRAICKIVQATGERGRCQQDENDDCGGTTGSRKKGHV